MELTIKKDIIVVGAGPAGLTCALYLAELYPGKSLHIIESASDVGGCHRSNWVNIDGRSLYYEHGPKIYSSRYTTLYEIIGKINKILGISLTFDQLFTKYKGGIGAALSSLLVTFAATDYILAMSVVFSPPGSMSVAEGFSGLSPPAQHAIDQLCRMIDGSAAHTTRMDKFLSTVRFSETLYQPRAPLGQTLFYYWKKALTALGVTISLNELVINRSHVLTTTQGRYSAHAIIFAIPPQSLNKIIPTFSADYLKNHSYISYYCVTLHYSSRVKEFSAPAQTPYGIIAVEMYWDNNIPTVIQCAISNVTTPGQNGKIATNCTNGELVLEIIGQLGIPAPKYAIIGSLPGDFPAYVDAVENVPIPWLVKDVYTTPPTYTIGTHNLTSSMKFTTFESAAESGKIFAMNQKISLEG